MNIPVYINGLGKYIPPKLLTNADLCAMVDTTDEWIRTRTGIEERHVIEPGTLSSDLALAAAREALANSGLKAEELTHVITATFSPDAPCPATACRVQHLIGAVNASALDLNAACSGFIYGLELAAGLIALKPSAKVLLVAAETLSLRTDWTDRSTCVLFGDGAGAAIVTGAPTPGAPKLEAILCEADGSLGELLICLGGGGMSPYSSGSVVGPEYFIHMQGREVFKHAVRSMSKICNRILSENNLTIQDIGCLIPHQANLRIIEAVGARLKMPASKVFVNVHKYGNTSAASIPIALAEATEQNFIPPDSRTLLTTFGGGFTWGAALLKF